MVRNIEKNPLTLFGRISFEVILNFKKIINRTVLD